MSNPVWEKITPNGKPFGFQSAEEQVLIAENTELKETIEAMKLEIKNLKTKVTKLTNKEV